MNNLEGSQEGTVPHWPAGTWKAPSIMNLSQYANDDNRDGFTHIITQVSNISVTTLGVWGQHSKKGIPMLLL